MINKEKIILVYCDGVCLDWEQAFILWMEHRGHKAVVENFKELYKVNEWFGMEREEGRRFIQEFNASAAMGFLPPLRDAQHYIKLLAEKYGYRFVAVTSMSDEPFAQKLRIKNLKKLFGEETFIDYHILPCGADKDEILLELKAKYEGCWWIEDKPENFYVGAELGYKCLLMKHAHNMHERCMMLENWEQITNHIIEAV